LLSASCPPWDEHSSSLTPASRMFYLTTGPESLEPRTTDWNLWNCVENIFLPLVSSLRYFVIEMRKIINKFMFAARVPEHIQYALEWSWRINGEIGQIWEQGLKVKNRVGVIVQTQCFLCRRMMWQNGLWKKDIGGREISAKIQNFRLSTCLACTRFWDPSSPL
jgi:hypothetical protein